MFCLGNRNQQILSNLLGKDKTNQGHGDEETKSDLEILLDKLLTKKLQEFEDKIQEKISGVEGKISGVEGKIKEKISYIQGKIEGKIEGKISNVEGQIKDIAKS